MTPTEYSFPDGGVIVSLRGREQEPQVADLIAMAQIHHPLYDRAERAPKIAEQYASTLAWELWGYEHEGELLGLAGVDPGDETVVRLQEIAVLPEARRTGVGRALLAFLRARYPTATIQGDTLEESAGFYTACNYEVAPNGTTLPTGEAVYTFIRRA
jgi:GNAT superfamily N-acetyltransferase